MLSTLHSAVRELQLIGYCHLPYAGSTAQLKNSAGTTGRGQAIQSPLIDSVQQRLTGLRPRLPKPVVLSDDEGGEALAGGHLETRSSLPISRPNQNLPRAFKNELKCK